MLTRFKRVVGNSPLGCFLNGYFRPPTNSAVTSGQSPLTSAAHESKLLYPCRVPFPEHCQPPKRAAMTRRKYKMSCSRYGANILFGYFTFLELGCPKQPRFNFAPELTSLQRIAAENIAGELLSFALPDRGLATTAPAGGRLHLANALSLLSELQAGQTIPADPSTVALPVIPDRVALPARGGAIDPAKTLPSHLVAQYEDWENSVRLPSSQWPLPLPRCCHTLEKSDELPFLRTLMSRGMGRLMSINDLPRDPYDGQVISSGFFCVAHKEDFDRLIQDKRPQNETERTLGWIHLPSGAQIGEIFLGRNQTLRGSADDFETYFYSVRAPPGSERWSAVGRAWGTDCFSDEELDGISRREGPVYFCMCVPGMGGRNSMDLCQQVHEGMLLEAKCLRPHETLRHRNPIPYGDVLEGAYADDHIVIQRLTVEQLKANVRLRDSEIVDTSVAVYESHGAALSLKKRVRNLENFAAWGTEVRGRRGMAGSISSKREQLACLVFDVMANRVVDRHCMEVMLGGFVHPFSHRLELHSVFHRSYKWKMELIEGRTYRLPADIRDEFLIASIYLALADSHMRADVTRTLVATDATPSAFGSCVAPCPKPILRELFRAHRHRGEAGRLDWQDKQATWHPTLMPRTDDITNRLFKSLEWVPRLSGKFARTAHINLQEARALKYEVRRLCADSPHECRTHRRLVVGLDSRVLVGAASKGRSSSYLLNGVLRTYTGILLGCRLAVAYPWVETHSNPADHPSRFADIPEPPPMDADLREWIAVARSREHETVAFCQSPGVDTPSSPVEAPLQQDHSRPGPAFQQSAADSGLAAVADTMPQAPSFSGEDSSPAVVEPTALGPSLPQHNAARGDMSSRGDPPDAPRAAASSSLPEPPAAHAAPRPRPSRPVLIGAPSRAELQRRIDLALSDKGRRMQQNILAQRVQRLRWSDGKAGQGRGDFVELYAGVGRVVTEVQALGARATSWEAFPSCEDDSGLGASTYVQDYDLCHGPSLLSLLEDIYGGRVSAAHLGTPCHTWGLLYQQCGPGTRSRSNWLGSLRDEKQILGNKTVGASLLIVRALYEAGGSCSVEHPLRSYMWLLGSFRSICGWQEVSKSRIDMCAYRLHPRNDSRTFYRKPTYIMHFGSGVFRPRQCPKDHNHQPVESSYYFEGKNVRRSQEAGEYTKDLARSLAAFHVSSCRRPRGGRGRCGGAEVSDPASRC